MLFSLGNPFSLPLKLTTINGKVCLTTGYQGAITTTQAIACTLNFWYKERDTFQTIIYVPLYGRVVRLILQETHDVPPLSYLEQKVGIVRRHLMI